MQNFVSFLVVIAISITIGVHGFVKSVEEDPDSHRYSLDEKSFNAAKLADIQEETGIKLPEGSKGVAYQYYPPIDPIVFAKIRIPAEGKQMLAEQIKAFKDVEFPEGGFAYDSCDWWPPDKKNVILFKRSYHGNWNLEMYLVDEDGTLMFYVEYFTI